MTKRTVSTLLSLVFFFVATSVFLVSTEKQASAIAAWARKYDAQCAACHYPAAPRLNATGERFRRAGYRMPNEIGKAQSIKDVGSFLGVRARARYVYNNVENGKDNNAFQWEDTTVFYGGAVTKNISGFFELEHSTEETEIVAQILGFMGSADQYATVRVGQFHTLTRTGWGGLDRPVGISSPAFFGNPTTTGVDFTLGTDQDGIELAGVFKDTRAVVQVLNGVDEGGVGDERGGVNNKRSSKDVLIVLQQILDNRASGVSLFGYRGVWDDAGTVAASNEFTFYRYGATANIVLPSDTGLSGGWVRSVDKFENGPGGVSSANGNAFYVEIEQYLEPADFTVLARWDYINPQGGVAHDGKRIVTIGAVKTVQENLKLTLEANQTDNRITDQTDYKVTTEAMLNF